jgi:hypothetical protein
MIIAMKIIILTIALYALDVIIWGSILGFICVLGYFSSNMFLGTDYSLTVSYFKGLVTYWVLDSILAKFREVYKVVIEDKIYKK